MRQRLFGLTFRRSSARGTDPDYCFDITARVEVADHFKKPRFQLFFKVREDPVGAFFVRYVYISEPVQIKLEGLKFNDLRVRDICNVNSGKIRIP